jgi:MHS family proline/betaine transporter-like MFS transporter
MLNREQKESIGLLSVGTFLEYFDLMLYVHLSVLLNQLFFPQFDTSHSSLLSAFTFCATFIFRPIGALVFGYIGDHLGRKTTVIVTTLMMSASCFIMAILPVYAQIGVLASWVFIICRIFQSFSSMSEIVGAEIYLTETIKRPEQFRAVALMSFVATLGGTVALAAACLITFLDVNWRIAFWIGASVAAVGTVARTRLRETYSFVHFKNQATKYLEEMHREPQYIKDILDYPTFQEKVNRKTILAYFLIHCGWPVCFYIAYIYCGNILQTSFNYSPPEVIWQSFILGIVNLISDFILRVYMASKIYPLKILKIMFFIFSIFILFCPYLLQNARSPFQLLLIQSFVVIFSLDVMPARSIFYSHFPVFKRFTYASFVYALSRTFIYIITSFGMLYLIKYTGHFGILIIIIPVLIGHWFGLSYFTKIEIKTGNYVPES